MKAILALALSIAATAAPAQTLVKDAWVRGTVAQQTATGLYAQITSTTGGRLVAASSPVAGGVEIHEMTMKGDVMQMRALPEGLSLPAGRVVKLEPGGYHIMLTGLKKPIVAGDSVPVTLIIEGPDKKRDSVQVRASVRALGAEAHKH